jgi:eukaryotic-like serine/threonine-protein kinase
MLHNIFRFLMSRIFLLNLLGVIIFVIAFFFIFAFAVNIYTQHGSSITIPDVRGKSVPEAKEIFSKAGLQTVAVDSSFEESLPPFSVIDENPKAGAEVKQGRTIYLTVNSGSAPQVQMPDLKDASLKQAQLILNSYGLRVGKLSYQPDIAQNAVLDQLIDGHHVDAGTMLSKNTTIDLVLGTGQTESDTDVPNLFGLTLQEARFVLAGSSLNLGEIFSDKKVKDDTLGAVIYSQTPAYDSTGKTKITLGDKIDVFITTKKEFRKNYQ